MEPLARRRRMLLVVLLLALPTACADEVPAGSSSARPSDPTTSPRGSATVTPERGTSDQDTPVPEILRFSAPRLGGGTIEGETFAGSDVALWFWAPW